MKKFALALVVAGIALSAKPMFADAIGSTVTGVLHLGNNTSVNYFDPANSQTPTHGSNSSGATLTIGTGAVAFDYARSVVTGYVPIIGAPTFGIDLIDAVFTGDQLVVTTTAPVSLGNFEMDFTDDAFAGAFLSNISNANGFGDSAAIVGNTLKVLVGAGVGLDVYSATVNCDPSSPASVTPEPGSFALLGTGLLGVCGVMRRRVMA